MIWRCLGRGLAFSVITYIGAITVDPYWPLGSSKARLLFPLLMVAGAWWGSAGSRRPKQGALCGGLTLLVPATFINAFLLLTQYLWGTPGTFGVKDFYPSLFVLGVPLLVGATVGAIVGYLNHRKLST